MSAHALPSPRLLLGPGPSCVTNRVLEAMARPPIGYLDPELFVLLEQLRANLRVLFGTSNQFTIPLTGTGMAGMECCLANLLEPGDNIVVGVIGFFGARIAEIARRLGAEVTVVDGEWGGVLDPEKINEAMRSFGRVKVLACVHAETSTGVQQPLEPLSDIAERYGALFLVDTVTSLGGLPINIDNLGVDVSYSGTQKCVGSPPGLAPITVSERAMSAAAARKTPLSHWYYDWSLLSKYYDTPHAYHHTVPVNSLYGLDMALQEIQEEGQENRFARHQKVSDLLMAGLQELGIDAFAQKDYRLPTLNTVNVPNSIADEAGVRSRLLQEYGIEIGGGLGDLKGRIWRIGTMGASATPRNVLTLVAALKNILAV